VCMCFCFFCFFCYIFPFFHVYVVYKFMINNSYWYWRCKKIFQPFSKEPLTWMDLKSRAAQTVPNLGRTQACTGLLRVLMYDIASFPIESSWKETGVEKWGRITDFWPGVKWGGMAAIFKNLGLNLWHLWQPQDLVFGKKKQNTRPSTPKKSLKRSRNWKAIVTNLHYEIGLKNVCIRTEMGQKYTDISCYWYNLSHQRDKELQSQMWPKWTTNFWHVHRAY